MNRRHFLVGVGGLVVGAAACDSNGLIDVEGTVTFDSAPVAEGSVTFRPDDKKLGPEGGTIKDGKFKMKSRPGKMHVEIMASREVPGKKDPMGTGPLIESYIPPRYNTNTELTADVSSSSKTFTFELKSK